MQKKKTYVEFIPVLFIRKIKVKMLVGSVRLLLYEPSKSQEFAIELAASLNQHRPHEQDD